MEINIEQKPPKTYADEIQLSNSKQVFNLKEIQEIKNAVQEHLIYIGLDRGNHIRTFKILGIGGSASVSIDSKDIIRTALINGNDRVILVHNHPSNSLKPSEQDKYLSNVTNKLLKTFSVELIDHIIVTENEYVSMGNLNEIDRNYEDSKIQYLENALLIEENNRLKQRIGEVEEQEELEE